MIDVRFRPRFGNETAVFKGKPVQQGVTEQENIEEFKPGMVYYDEDLGQTMRIQTVIPHVNNKQAGVQGILTVLKQVSEQIANARPEELVQIRDDIAVIIHDHCLLNPVIRPILERALQEREEQLKQS